MGKSPPGNPQGPRAADAATAAAAQAVTETRETLLDTLLAHRQVWQASAVKERPALGVDTGHDPLNGLLPEGGWPRDGLTELITDQRGIGELRLLMPALASLSRNENRWIAWIRSPHIPYAPALEACGIDTSKVLLIHPRSHRDTLWTIEQALKTGTCAAVLAWPDDERLKLQEIRRLQLAARQGCAWGVMFRPEQTLQEASPAELRIQLRSPRDETDTSRLVEIKIVKRRGGWPTEFFALELDPDVTGTAPGTLAEQLELWRKLKIANAESEESIYAKDDRIFFSPAVSPVERPAVSPVERPAVSPVERIRPAVSSARVLH